MEFRIIAGSLKGKKITSPDLGVTRPPLTRLRKSIFDFLMPYIREASYLDLYSGTGSYLFEAVSRGAVQAEGIEMEPLLAEAINAQAARFGIADRLTCICDNLFKQIPKLSKAGKQYDIVMMAPPQYKGLVDKTLNLLYKRRVTRPDSLIICQHDTSEVEEITFDRFTLLQRRKYGNTTFTVFNGEQRKN
jgi:16S rRNA (guanine(966)-N(2))-methyltransferase RsmD